MIIALAAEKGGAGKTTTAVNVAAWRARQGRRVLLVDGDIKQASASAWVAFRMQHENAAPVECVRIDSGILAKQVRAMAKDYDDIVIDYRGAADGGMLGALSVAHRCVTPCRPGQWDLVSLANMSELVETARGANPDLDAVAFINQAVTNDGGTDEREAQEVIADVPGYRLLQPVIHLLKPFARCAATGLSVLELEPAGSRSVRELEAVAAEVWA
jgi:chromosome partitioning protein